MTAPATAPSPGTPAPPVSVERLVLAANRIFHDLEGESYEEKHDEIFVAESERWSRLASRWLAPAPGAPPRTLLDLGSGTGFVPRAIGPGLAASDEIVLSDLSIAMLACARRRLAAAGIGCRLRFEPVDGVRYPFPSKSFDAVTANSFVHHVPDLRRLFSEIDRLLRPGGILAIGHEPNLLHYRCPGLARWRKLLSIPGDPFQAAIGAARALRLDRLAERFGVRGRVRGAVLRARGGDLAVQVRRTEAILDRVATQMTAEGLVEEPPTREQLVRWIDIHSPSAGSTIDPMRGLEVERVRRDWLPDYELLHLETYDHLFSGGHAARRTAILSALDRWLARRYPEAGATLTFVLRKPL